MRFIFQLQRLLELKGKRERELARQLAVAQTQATTEQGRQDTLDTLRANASDQLVAATDAQSRVGELRTMSYSVQQLSEQADAQGQRVEHAQRSVAERQGALNSAVQERRVLDRLRDKQLAQHKSDEHHRDRGVMDEVAITRFAATQRQADEHGGV